MTTTLRKCLTDRGFEFTDEKARIIYHPVGYDRAPGWARIKGEPEIITSPWEHPILDKEFYSGYGSAEMPRFVAEDSDFIYFPSQYDGSTEIVFVYKDLDAYTTKNVVPKETPYPGG